MEEITKHVVVPVVASRAFSNFVDSLGAWWPSAYTWSQDQLQSIAIEGKENGLCTEIGPYGFRCDWGRVITYEAGSEISFTWQISPNRVPEPSPERASLVMIEFASDGTKTDVTLTHSNFQRHGEGAEEYRVAMASDRGWEHILGQYESYCERQT